MDRCADRLLAVRSLVAGLGLGLVLIAAPSAHAADAVRLVTSGDDAGPGSFRAAIEEANADPSVRRIVFRPGLTVTLLSDVVYTGAQTLSIHGNGSEVIGDPAAPPADTWDGGLFQATGGGDLRISNLAFRQSFNNGIGVFVPAEQSGTVSVSLKDVTIERSRFHGLFFDGQSSSGFNTDGVIHPDCTDPFPFDSDASLSLSVQRSEVSDNGTLVGGFDTGTEFEVDGETFLTGCPADFDGVRVDDGDAGSIHAVISRSRVEGNLADGIEYDETGEGGVSAVITHTDVAGNGNTGTDDLDDGFDIDEAGDGNLRVLVVHSSFTDNFDEGLDFDEDDAGAVLATFVHVEASRNEDEGFKIDETGPGDLRSFVIASTINNSLSQQGIDLTEEDAGDYDVLLVRTEVTGNDDEGLASEQVEPGTGQLTLIRSDLTDNGDPSLDLEGIELRNIGSLLD